MNPIFYAAPAVIIVIWNIITFALYGIDKSRAKNNKWRVSEVALITCAFLMGGIGAMLGMNIFRHKTKHLKFKILILLAIAVNIVLLVAYFYIFLFYTA